MIAKRYRLDEDELRKVLRLRKPFFSYTLVANIAPNRLGRGRFGIVFSGKQAKTSVSRNYYRRLFYDTVRPFTQTLSLDVVFVPKKGKEFDKNDEATILDFKQTVAFLLRKISKEAQEIKPKNTIPQSRGDTVEKSPLQIKE